MAKQAPLDPQLGDRDGLPHRIPGQGLRRRRGHDTADRRLAQDHYLPVGQHPGVYPADAPEAQEALFDPCHQQTDLI